MNLIPRRQVNRNLFTDLLDIQKEISDLFEFPSSRWDGRDEGLLSSAWTPAIDIYDSKDNLVVKADLPGIKKEDIEVSVQDGTLVIKGEKKEESEKKDKGWVRTERYYGSFYRAIALPATVDEAKVKANYKEGVLELAFPKKEEAKPKKIQIDVN